MFTRFPRFSRSVAIVAALLVLSAVSPAGAQQVANFSTGGIQIGNSTATCGSTYAGALRWNGSAVQYCDGTAWQTLSSSGGAVAAAAPANSVQFNNAGALGGSANLTWNSGTSTLDLGGDLLFGSGQEFIPTSGTRTTLQPSSGSNNSDFVVEPSGSGSVSNIYLAGDSGFGASQNWGFLTENGPNMQVGSYNNLGTLTLMTNNRSALTIAANGTAMIGTASPLAGLDVQNAVTAASGLAYGTRVQQTLNAAANNDTLYGLYINPTYTPGSYTGVRTFDLAFAGGHDRTIGVELNGSAAGNALLVRAGGTSGGTNIAGGDLTLSGGQGTGSAGSNIIFKASAAGASGTTSNAPAEAMRVASNGYVGIGTTAPTSKLQVDGGGLLVRNTGVAAYSSVIGKGDAYTYADLQLGNYNTGAMWTAEMRKDFDGYFFIEHYDGVSTYGEDFVISPAGNVGIGTTSPATKLQVAGTVMVGNGGETCGSTYGGGIRWTGTVLQYCDGSSTWQTVASSAGSTTSLSALTAATAANTIDNTNFAQTWNWSTLTTGNGLTLTANALTSGSVLSVSSSSANATNALIYSSAGATTAIGGVTSGGYDAGVQGTGLGSTSYGVLAYQTAANNTGDAGYFGQQPGTSSTAVDYAVYATNNSKGAAYGVYSTMTTTSNTGYAGYFSNVGGAVVNYGAYAGTAATGAAYALYATESGNSNTGYGLYAINKPTTNAGVNYGGYFEDNSTAAAFGVKAVESGASNTGYAGNFTNSGGGAVVNYGALATTNATGAAYGLYSSETGNSNTGYGVYAINKPATNAGINYAAYFEDNSTAAAFGVKAVESGASNTGYAGNFTNSGGGAVVDYGALGTTNATGAAFGIYGSETGASNTGYGVYGLNNSSTGFGVYGSNSAGYAVYSNGNAYVNGNFTVTGTCTGCSSGGGAALSAITAATAANTISNGNNAQAWNWSLTSNSNSAFTLGEAAAATGTGDAILRVMTLSGSTATPFVINNAGAATVAASVTAGDLNLAAGAVEIGGTKVLALPAADANYSLAVGLGALVADSNSGGGSAGLYNTAAGYQALNANTTGTSSTAVGTSALATATTGTNSAFGYQAGRYISTGSGNVAIGDGAMTGVGGTPMTGPANTALGENSMNALQGPATSNTAIGQSSLYRLTTGNYNVAVGQTALQYDTVGGNNTAIGWAALGSTTSGPNTAVGSQAGVFISGGAHNVAIGASAMMGTNSSNLTGSFNTAVGDSALYTLQGGTYGDVGIGYQSGYSMTTGNSNTTVGTYSGYNVTTGVDNTSLGYQSLGAATSGSFNTAIGMNALYYVTGGHSTAVGFYALSTATTGVNTAVGDSALRYATTASGNTAVGMNAMQGTSGTPLTGTGNTAIGDTAMANLQGSSGNNTAIGQSAMQYNISGSYDVAVGNNALASSNTTYNTAVGTNALEYTSGNSNIALGYNSGYNVSSGTQNILIGGGGNINSGSGNILIGNALAGTTAANSNQLDIGDLIYGALGTGKVGIGTSSPGSNLDIYGTNPEFWVQNAGDGNLGTYIEDTYAAMQFGLFNTGGSSVNAIGPTSQVGLFAMDSQGHVGSGANSGGIGGANTFTFRNLLDDGNGNGGFGTTAPVTRLQVNGTLKIGDGGETCGSTYAGGIRWTGSALQYCDGTNWQVVTSSGGGASWSSLSSPTANLSLAMGADTTNMTWGAATGSGTNLLTMTDTANNTGTGDLLNVVTASGSTLLPFHVSAAGNEAINVTPDGHVEMGTTATGVSAQFAVFSTGVVSRFIGNGNAPALVISQNSSSGPNTFQLYPFTDGNTYAQHDGNVIFAALGSTTPQLVVASGGNVGIGTNSPTSTLTVAGDITYSGTMTQTSDARLKKDITPLDPDDIQRKLGEINTYSYRLKADPAQQLQYGVLAQEVEKVFPALVVTHDDAMHSKAVNYIGFIAPLLESNQTLVASNKALAAQNVALRAEVEQLNAKSRTTDAALNDMQKQINGMKGYTGYGVSKAGFTWWQVLLMLSAAGGTCGVVIVRSRKPARK